jgi:hypothetical protein
MKALALILFLLSGPAMAAEVCVTIPNAVVSKANAVCSIYVEGYNVDTPPTSTECIESMIRNRVMELAKKKVQDDATNQAQQEVTTEMDAIEAAWPDMLDLNVCGDNEQDAGEECDGTWDAACGGEVCLPNCNCYVEPPPVDPNEVMP